MIIYKTLLMAVAIAGISDFANTGNLSMFFVGLFGCVMYNFFSWVERLPEINNLNIT